jgi:N-acetylmuramic acid 6-phosphate etherase
MIDEETSIGPALRKVRPQIERAVEVVVASFAGSGRLFYVGAGTSGRLGLLDALECPSTFHSPPEQVQAIVAGGQAALFVPNEAREDDSKRGAMAVARRGVNRKDVVMGIAASGRTPFVWGAIQEGKRRGAKTILLCFNPYLEIPLALRPDVVIAGNVGPELLTGSTRLKAGTATKIVLNTLTTLAMVRMGKVKSNLMIDLDPSNEKLRDRAVRIVQSLSRADADVARSALKCSNWNVKAALQALQ